MSDQERQLACAVINQAMIDLEQPNALNHPRDVHKAKDEARRFLTDKEGRWAESRETWCNLAGIEPEAVVQAALAIQSR